MRVFLHRLASVFGVISKIALYFAGTGLVLMTVFIAYQIYGRFVLNDTPTWTESVSVIIMSWFIFLGAAVGIREGYHLSFDVLLYVLPEKAKQVLYTVSDLIVIAFGTGMIVYGAQLAIGTWDSTIPNVGWPTGVTYLSLVAGGILVVLFSLERVARRFAGLPTARFGDDSDISES